MAISPDECQKKLAGIEAQMKQLEAQAETACGMPIRNAVNKEEGIIGSEGLEQAVAPGAQLVFDGADAASTAYTECAKNTFNHSACEGTDKMAMLTKFENDYAALSKIREDQISYATKLKNFDMPEAMQAMFKPGSPLNV